MKSFYSSIRFVIVLCIVLITLVRCDSTGSDWTKARSLNNKQAYIDFLNKHKSDQLSLKAQYYIDSLNWAEYVSTHNLDSLRSCLNRSLSSEFLKNSGYAIDSIEWIIAYDTEDTAKLREYIKKYTVSFNNQKAEKIIRKVRWQPVTVGNANSIYIGNNNGGTFYGQLLFRDDANGIGHFAGGMGPNRIRIWKGFQNEEMPFVKKTGLEKGAAYLETEDGKYYFIRSINVEISDAQICKTFGIDGSSGWKVDFERGPFKNNR